MIDTGSAPGAWAEAIPYKFGAAVEDVAPSPRASGGSARAPLLRGWRRSPVFRLAGASPLIPLACHALPQLSPSLTAMCHRGPIYPSIVNKLKRGEVLCQLTRF